MDQQQVRDKEKKIGNYLLGKTIGQGTFGKVKMATHTLTGEKVAIKILVKEKIIDVADVERVSRQIHILKLIRHPSIIQLYEIIETSRHLFLVMQYVQNGELFDYIVKHTKIQQSAACKYFKHIISGVAYLHKLNIVHRDLKPENLLIDWKNSLKIVDFGLSNTYKEDQLLKTACGSPCYAAPEMIASKKYHGLQVDIWSCGVILFAMVCGYLPFEDNNTSQLYKKILSGEYVLPSFITSDFKDLLEKILNVEPEKRFSLEEIYTHPWCKQQQTIPLNSGIMVGYHRIPIDQTILKELAKFDFDLEYSARCIEANKHNHITTTYYLLLKKHLRNGHQSSADLSSPDFDYTSVEPFKRVQAEQKYNFFGNHQDKNPLLNLDSNDIQLGRKEERNIFNIKPSTSKNKQKPLYSSEHRKSNNLLEKSKKRNDSSIINNTRQFHDLRMYLKVPRKKQYYSEAKKNKRDDRHRNHSVYYEPKRKEDDDQLVLRLQTEHSEDKKKGPFRAKYSKLRPYNQNRGSKIHRNF